jgi:proteasome accessory factor A
MRERVFGIETEYAVIYHPGRGDRERPTNLALYGLFEPLLARRVRSLPRAFSLLRGKPGRFLENGASFHYEATPQDFEHGLVEMASPECRDPFVLLAHERAKDALIEELAREVTATLRAAGLRGEVRIGKNNVDSAGHTFGSHESYWIEDPLPLPRKLLLLPLWLALWALALPVFVWLVGASLALVLGLAGLLAVAPLAPPRFRARLRVLDRGPGELAQRFAWVEVPLHPLLALHSWMYRQFHFRGVQRDLTAFLVTRAIWCGAGAVTLGDAPGDAPDRAAGGGPLLRVSQRAPFLRSFSRVFTSGEGRPLYESRDLFFRPWSALGSRRRLHLLLGDANLCDWALVLRVGATALVLEAIESGADVAWPRLARPLEALRTVGADPDLGAELALEDGCRATAFVIQRRVLEGVRRALAAELAVAGAGASAAWKPRVFAMWEETLDTLERDPDRLADRVDWIAKRGLLRREVPRPEDRAALRQRGVRLVTGPPPADPEERRLRALAFRALRTDLRYHELGPRGGHRRLEEAGRARRLVDPDAVARARREPPPDTRAFGRGRAIREAALRRVKGGATWHRVRLGRFDWRFFPDPLEPGARRPRLAPPGPG